MNLAEAGGGRRKSVHVDGGGDNIMLARMFGELSHSSWPIRMK